MINLGISIGTDIVEVERITNAINNGGKFFLQRVFTKKEIMKINANEPDFERATGFWAAKESIVKALGCGFRNGVCFKDIEINHDEFGCPSFLFTGRLGEVIKENGVINVSLSISHCRTHAVAVSLVNSIACNGNV
ncbi:holo-[acyl-carrier-protein] synthase [Kosakonia sacchari]|nr:holo-[acyl-carrier-protein] synthase [Kosakonia sacchari]